MLNNYKNLAIVNKTLLKDALELKKNYTHRS